MRGNAWVVARGDEPLTLTRCCSYKKPLKGGIQSVAKHKGIKGKFFFISFTFTNILLLLISCHDACRPCGCGN